MTSYRIERAAPADAEALLAFLKTVGAETDNLTFGAEGLPLSVEVERNYLASVQESSVSAFFLAKIGDEIVGDASFSGSSRERLKHRGELGVSVRRDAWGMGIGKALIRQVLDFAEQTAGAEAVTLTVRSDNARAIALYRAFGFEKTGTFPGFLKVNGEPIDFDFMYLSLSGRKMI